MLSGPLCERQFVSDLFLKILVIQDNDFLALLLALHARGRWFDPRWLHSVRQRPLAGAWGLRGVLSGGGGGLLPETRPGLVSGGQITH